MTLHAKSGAHGFMEFVFFRSIFVDENYQEHRHNSDWNLLNCNDLERFLFPAKFIEVV
jgi:hypothetical protein